MMLLKKRFRRHEQARTQRGLRCHRIGTNVVTSELKRWCTSGVDWNTYGILVKGLIARLSCDVFRQKPIDEQIVYINECLWESAFAQMVPHAQPIYSSDPQHVLFYEDGHGVCAQQACTCYDNL
uniref:Uncharacterized protein n=1 Tax=Glossina austeni TaxID=7395 RepID=A0A1A9V7W4_GLOAU